jgi:hypothetical protein
MTADLHRLDSNYTLQVCFLQAILLNKTHHASFGVSVTLERPEGRASSCLLMSCHA